MLKRHTTSLFLGLAIAMSGTVQLHAQSAPNAPHKIARSPAAGTLFLYPERIPAEGGGFIDVERGIYFASANRNDPNSDVVGIEIYRFKASKNADPKTPPIFRLNGGPNFAGLEDRLDRRGYYEESVAPFTEAADFVVIGQRGIGSSKPTTLCERPEGSAPDATAAELREKDQAAARRCQAFWRDAGVDLSGLTVIQAAADVDEIRRALGYDRIQIWGGSFGSHWGMAVMRYYPETVTRAVLRGLEGPDHTYDTPGGIARALERIAAAADTATAFKGMIPAGGLYKAFNDVIAKLDRNPVNVTITDTEAKTSQTVRVDGDAVRAIAVTGARGWPAMVLALHAGDYTQAARALIRRNASPGIETASYYVLDCGSGISAARDAELLADPATRVVGERNGEYRNVCPVWPSDNGDAFRKNFETTIPTLFVQGDWDTSTPIENSRELQPFFKNLHYTLVKGGSHGALIEAINVSPAFRQQLMEWFATGDKAGLQDVVVMPPVKWNAPRGTGR